MNLENTRKLLAEFHFGKLFVEELGWNQPTASKAAACETKGLRYSRRMISQMAGVAVFEIVGADGLPDRKGREAIERDIAKEYRENLCIFLERSETPTQSFWVWTNRDRDERGRARAFYREHTYFRGQPADLFISKLQALVVELSELDEDGNLPVVEVARRMKDALDVERVTRKFFRAYEEQHGEFLRLIRGIDDERDRRWYASILLNRLMFVWFLQRKGFLDAAPGAAHGDYDYLPSRLSESKKRGKDRFFAEFLKVLFFEAFAKSEDERSKEAKALTGRIRFLNGGLFLPHRIECDADSITLRVGKTLTIPDKAFENLFELFGAYSWNLDDTPGGQADEINPAVLGYIFEKYINQKAFGAYYTRPEITDYLCEHTIHALILERVNKPAIPELNLPAIEFDSVPELLARMDGKLAHELLQSVLPDLKLLDPAVGSGAFLVAAMKVLINVYMAIVGRAELGTDRSLRAWLEHEHAAHKNIGYAIKRRIITDNLFGVDIMEEATEIAKLRLFLALVASAQREEELEPLPNIDFNIMSGNSLVGLMRVSDEEFEKVDHATGSAETIDMFKPPYRKLLEEKNRLIDNYRHIAADLKSIDLKTLRDNIDEKKREATAVLNELQRDDFERLGVKFEQATWDDKKGDEGKPAKRRIELRDIEAQRPFHWGYEFDEIMQRRGGFDVIITNPPWEIFKPQAKEFFAEHSELVTKNKMTIKAFEKEQKKLLKNKEIREAWLEYQSRFPHMSAYFRASSQYASQTALVNGKKTGSDLNLYKLFLEQCYNLLKPGGRCGIVIPSGVYTDLGAKGLRDLLFEHTRIEGLFCFENRKSIFEGVDSRFKFVVLTFEKTVVPRVATPGARASSAPPDDLLAPARTGAVGTTEFPAAFMRHDVAELARFPKQGSIPIHVTLVKKLSPDAHSVMEFKSALDVIIAEKMLKYPLLGESIEDTWHVSFTAEFHMTNDSHLFKTEPGKGRLPLYEGKMIWQFEHCYAEPRYWVEETAGRKALVGRTPDRSQSLDYQSYRLGFRDIARNTDTRTMICSVIPPVFHGNKLPTVRIFDDIGARLIDDATQLYLCAVWNSFVIDWMLRQKVTTTLNFFYLYQLPIPRYTIKNREYKPLAERAARLVCTTPEFNDLAKAVGIKNHKAGVTEPEERARLRAELDGLIAHLYGLTEDEFAHILSTFPLVDDAVKVAARNAYRDVERGLLQ
jgi:hypothetical protein